MSESATVTRVAFRRLTHRVGRPGASRPEPAATLPAPHRPRRRRPTRPSSWSIRLLVGGALLVLVATVVGHAVRPKTAPAPRRAATKPVALPPPADPRAPAQIITPGWDVPNPFMLKIGATYYLYSSQTTNYSLYFGHPSPEVALRTTTDLQNWSPPGEALPTLPRWATWGYTWAPDVRRFRDRYVMYYTARVKGRTPDTECIGAATSPTPSGPFVPIDQVFVCQLDHGGSIDPRSFVDRDGTPWLLWKSDENSDTEGETHTGIYAQRLTTDGLRLLGTPTMILTADQPWEGRIVEAPQMVLVGTHYWLFYSGNWFNEPAYAIGVAACSGPAGPCFKPFTRPLVSSNAQGDGPGEGSLFTDERGLWMVYGPLAIQYRATDTKRPVALAHIAFNDAGPYLTAF